MAVLAVVITAATAGTSAAKTGPAAAPKAEPTTETTTTTTRPTTTTTRRPTSSTRPTTTTTRTTTRATPAGPRPVYATGENPLFADHVGGLPAVTCTLSRWRSNPAAAEAFFRSALLCLEAAWAPVLKRANLPYKAPGLAVPAGRNGAGACPSRTAPDDTPFYCYSTHTIVMPFGTLYVERYGAHPGVYLAVLAHEYGHHVQWLAGVGDAYGTARSKAGMDSPAGLELSRRLELQAQCFAGMFTAATAGRGDVDRNIVQEGRSTQDVGDQRGKPRDHGTEAHNIGWYEQGYTKNSTRQCNTWLAPADVVS